VTSAVNFSNGTRQVVDITGTTEVTGHFVNVSSYNVRCGPGPLDSTETGVGNLSKQ
jgi:hypothetical protein